MRSYSGEELKEIMEKLKSEISPDLAASLREARDAISASMLEQRETLYSIINQVLEELRDYTPELPGDKWREVAVISRNLGLPIRVVLGELVMKALGDPRDRVEYHLGLSRRFLGEGLRLLGEGDYVQASEKLWGAAAQAVKAAAAREGLELKRHRDLWDYIKRLAERTGDDELVLLFDRADSLHRNFYEGVLPGRLVEMYAESVRELVERIEGILREHEETQ
ncbi:MAG: PaREP1 family protein [Desulfurococcales archaeon]|nr:PaREP1 family protein [Desulfurococcales archaeon]